MNPIIGIQALTLNRSQHNINNQTIIPTMHPSYIKPYHDSNPKIISILLTIQAAEYPFNKYNSHGIAP